MSSIQHNKPFVICNVTHIGVSRLVTLVQTTCCLIRPASELIVKSGAPSNHAMTFGWLAIRIHCSHNRQTGWKNVNVKCKCPLISVQLPHSPSHLNYSAPLSSTVGPPKMNVALWVIEWLYSVLKQLRSWIQTECTWPPECKWVGLSVGELCVILSGPLSETPFTGRDPTNDPRVCKAVGHI